MSSDSLIAHGFVFPAGHVGTGLCDGGSDPGHCRAYGVSRGSLGGLARP